MRRTSVDKREKAHTYYNTSIASSLRSSKSYDKGRVHSGRRICPPETIRPCKPDEAIPQKIHYTCTPRANKKLAFNNLFQSSGPNTRSEDQDDSKSKNGSNEFGFGEYAETVGPQGLLFVLKGPDIPNLRLNWHLSSTNGKPYDI